MNSNFYRELYLFEWELRHRITSWLQIPIAALTVLGGGAIVLAQGFPYDDSARTMAFVLAILLALMSLGLAGYFVVRCLHGYEYAKLPRSSEIRELLEKRREYLSACGESPDEAERYLEDFIHRRMAEATDRNADNNAIKSAFLHKANQWTVWTLVLLAVSAVPYTWQTILAQGEPSRVELINPVTLTQEVPMIERERNSGESDRPVAPQIPEPPPEPPNELIKEDKLPGILAPDVGRQDG